MESPTSEEGFICNLEEHWFAVRKVYGEWFNFDSTAKRPSRLSQFYLSAFLDTLVKGGYSIFVVRGEYPAVIPQPSQPNWVPVPTDNQGGSSSQLSEDEELQKAIAASLGTNIPVTVPSGDQEDQELARAIEASLAGSSQVESDNEMDDDEELMAAILLSQQGNISGQDANEETLKRLISFQEENQGKSDSTGANILVEVPSLQKRTPCTVPAEASLRVLTLISCKVD